MGKQVGPLFIVGTTGNLTFYKLYGEYLVRQKSSLSGKRVKTSAEFRNTMRNANWFGQASSIAALIRRALPAEERKAVKIGVVTRMVLPYVRNGFSREQILELLMPAPGVRRLTKPNEVTGLSKVTAGSEAPGLLKQPQQPVATVKDKRPGKMILAPTRLRSLSRRMIRDSYQHGRLRRAIRRRRAVKHFR